VIANFPGVYEIEWGMTVAELLDFCGAEDPYFIQVSGPSGESISIKEKYRRISMLDLLAQKDIRCGGSFMIFNSHRDLGSHFVKLLSILQARIVWSMYALPCRQLHHSAKAGAVAKWIGRHE
jgi:hypothetical protein